MQPDDDDIDSSKLGSLGGSLDGMSRDYIPSGLPEGLLTPNGKGVPPQVAQKALPPMSALNMICFRGPCRFLLQSTSELEVEAGDYEAESVDRTCLVQTGTLIEVKSPVYTCSHWDPVQEDAGTKAREKRRRVYLEKHPEVLKEDADRAERRRKMREKIDAEAAVRQREIDIEKAKKAEQIEKGEFDPQD